MAENTITIRDQRTQKRFFTDNYFVDVYGPIVGPYGHAVYNVLLRHARPTGEGSWPSHKTIAKKAGCSVAKVKKVLKQFADLKLIFIKSRYDQKTGSQTSNEYLILDPSALEDAPAVGDTPAGYLEDTPSEVSQGATNNPPIDQSTLNNPHKDPSPAEKSPSTSSPGKTNGRLSTPSQLPGIPTLDPDTPGAKYLFKRLAEEQAIRQRKAKPDFPSLGCKRDFMSAEENLGLERTKEAIDAAFRKPILALDQITAWVMEFTKSDGKPWKNDNRPPPIRNRVTIEELPDGHTHTIIRGRL